MCIDVPEVRLKLLINNKAVSDVDDDVVISEFDKVEFTCTSSASPPVSSWRYSTVYS